MRRVGRTTPAILGRIGLLCALATFPLPACRPRTDPVRDTLEAVRRAAEKRDAGAVSRRLAGEFRADDGQGRGEVQATLARLFAAYESVTVSLDDVSIERSEGAARARFRAGMAGRPRKLGGLDGLLPARAVFRFDTRLAPEAGEWKIVWARWEQLE